MQQLKMTLLGPFFFLGGAPCFDVPPLPTLPANHAYMKKKLNKGSVTLSLMLVEEGTLIEVTQVNNVFALNACFKLTIFCNYKW